MASRKRSRVEHQPESVRPPTTENRDKQDKPAEPSALDAPPPRRSARIKALNEKTTAAQPPAPRKQQQPTKNLRGPAHLAKQSASTPKSAPTAKAKPTPKAKGSGKQKPLQAVRREPLSDHPANQTSQSAPADQPLRPEGTSKQPQPPARNYIDSRILARPEPRTTTRVRRTESWVQSVRQLAKEGAMAPPATRSTQGQPKRNAKGVAANRAVERVAGISEVASESQATDQLTDQAIAIRKTAAIYKSGKCIEKLNEGNGLVHMYMTEQELFSSRREPRHGLSKKSEEWIQDLKGGKEDKMSPMNGLFDAKSFESLLLRLENQNEFGVTQDLQDFVCPVVAKLAALHSDDEVLGKAYDLLDDRWDNLWIEIPAVLPEFGRPRPDYCVGFERTSFGPGRRSKLNLIASEKEILKPTALVYFPFLTCEVKSWQQPLRYAENQNGHSILIAVLRMVELFRMAHMDVNGHILAFSVCYNFSEALMHAYYPIINGEETNVCRHRLGKCVLDPNDNPDPWRSWRLVRNVYEKWAPDLHRRLCEAIDAVKLDVEGPEPSESVDPEARPAPSESADPMDVQSDVTPRPDVMSTDGRAGGYGGGGRAAPRESRELPSPKRPRRR